MSRNCACLGLGEHGRLGRRQRRHAEDQIRSPHTITPTYLTANFNDRYSITMKTATVADLRNNFALLSKWIHDGEAVTITKRGNAFATLAPVRRKKSAPHVDRLARVRRIFPKGPVPGNIQQVIDYDRGNT